MVSAGPIDRPQPDAELRHVAVDLTPVLPGGENGGAKLVALTLVRHFSRVAPDCRFTLFTYAKSHNELASLDTANVRRLCLDAANIDAAIDASSDRVAGPRRSRLLREIGADLLFCPLTASKVFDPTVPVVSVVHDLQDRAYRQFFTAAERTARDAQFRETCRIADRVICVSDFVRSTVLEHADLDPERVLTIPNGLAHPLRPAPPDVVARVIDRLGLRPERFLLYPANFWPHKNHRMLLTALALYRVQRPASDLGLVCTGAPGRRMDEVRDAARRVGVAESVRFPGFVAEDELAALFQSCLALVFPSLYEGFGMPILEAMAFDKPVLSSNAASLPEVAGDAALLFDPNKPVEMADAIERIEHDAELRAHLIARGRERVAAFDGPEQVARRYLEVFRDVVSSPSPAPARLHGVYPDGWTSERVVVAYGPSEEERHLDVLLAAPPWMPFGSISAEVLHDTSDDAETCLIGRGEAVHLRRSLAPAGGSLDILFDRAFDHHAYGLGEDRRTVSVILQACWIVSMTRAFDLLEESRL